MAYTTILSESVWKLFLAWADFNIVYEQVAPGVNNAIRALEKEVTGKESGDDMETIIETLRPVCSNEKIKFSNESKTFEYIITWYSLLHVKNDQNPLFSYNTNFVLREIREIQQVANQFKDIILHMLLPMLTIGYHGRILVILGVGNQSVVMEYFTQQMQKRNS